MFADRTNWNLSANRLSEALARRRASGKPLLDLTASNPTTCGFQYDRDRILGALASPAVLAYKPEPRGLATARKAVAEYYAARGNRISANDMILTTSTSEAYSFVFRLLCNPGDELLIPAPSYPLFEFLSDLQDVRLARYPLVYDHGWQMDLPTLEKSISGRTRGLIVVHPNNPTGHFVKRKEAERLNGICSGRGIALIADEVFLDFAIGEGSPASFAANHEALTFTMSGLSKISGLPQMKAAWLVVSGPEKLKSGAMARLEVIADTFLSMNTPVQLAIPAFLELRSKFQTQLMVRVRKNVTELDGQLAGQKICSRLEVEGGWYAVLRVPATRSDEELAIDLLTQRGLYVHPGHLYDFGGDGFLVISLITPEREFAEGLKLLLAAF
jgi:alanine-synthesizing transaminase